MAGVPETVIVLRFHHLPLCRLVDSRMSNCHYPRHERPASVAAQLLRSSLAVVMELCPGTMHAMETRSSRVLVWDIRPDLPRDRSRDFV